MFSHSELFDTIGVCVCVCVWGNLSHSLRILYLNILILLYNTSDRFPQLQAGAGGMGESTFGERAIMSGRLVCDTYICSREFLREKQYSLLYLVIFPIFVYVGH